MKDIRQTQNMSMKYAWSYLKDTRLFIFHEQELPVFNDKIQADKFLIKPFSL